MAGSICVQPYLGPLQAAVCPNDRDRAYIAFQSSHSICPTQAPAQLLGTALLWPPSHLLDAVDPERERDCLHLPYTGTGSALLDIPTLPTASPPRWATVATDPVCSLTAKQGHRLTSSMGRC
ncbi:hypothetical protein L7F22_052204 [Adiantum nelumboides]|nr:hypothetical protein [Adiantum nelumboides]